MTPGRADTQYPDVAEFTAHVASLHGLKRVVDIGLSWTPQVAGAYPGLRVTGVALPGQAVHSPPAYPTTRIADLETLSVDVGSPTPDAARSGLLLAGPHEQLCGADGILRRLAASVSLAPLLVVATDDADPVLSQLASAALRPEFSGRTRVSNVDEARSAHLVVVDRILARFRQEPTSAPDGFRVVAIMMVYNEEDVIGPAIEKLVGDGVGVYVIDNWSTDRSAKIARTFEGRGLVGIERFPDAPTDRFVLQALLERVEAVATELEADWLIHHDADERRSGPWPQLGLRDSLWRVDQAGFSAVDHTVVNYRPVDNDFRPGEDFELQLRHFEFGRSGDLMLQVKAWKNVGRVTLALAGHEVVFPGRRVFPYKFLLKHYPIRSQSHGQRKIVAERGGRWDPGERALGWHKHYDGIGPDHSFLREPSELIEDRGEVTRTLYLPEMLTGAGLATRRLPAWALRGRIGWELYLRSRPITRSGAYQAVRRLVLPKTTPRRRRGAGR